MHLIYRNDLGKNVTFSLEKPFILSDTYDFESLGATAQTVNPIGLDGALTTDITLNQRTITFKAYVYAKSDNVFEPEWSIAHLKNLLEILNPKVFGTCTVFNSNGTFELRCRPVEVPNYKKIAGSCYEVDIKLISDIPYWQNIKKNTFNPITLVGGLRFPLQFPISFAEVTPGIEITINKISENIPVTIEGTIPKNGQLISLTNLDTEQRIKMNAPSSIDEYKFKIDTNTCQVTKNAHPTYKWEKANFIFSFDSDLNFYLAPGINRIELQATNDVKNSITITYAERYIAI